jgi:prepilin-type N-terminal cleavage/methylation domain-containing protein
MISKKEIKTQSGFTLIELVVVIGILAVLFAIVLIAINPSKQFKSANDTKRSSDVNAILNAVYQFSADEKGALPSGITTTSKVISTSGLGTATFCNDLVPEYIAALPTDPLKADFVNCATSFDTGYSIIQTAAGRVTVSATAETPDKIISVTR